LRFPPHQAVQKYLETYADAFSLRPLISFGRRVVSVEPLLGGGNHEGFRSVSWQVTTAASDGTPEGEEDITEVQDFDVVVVCNGHYSEPRCPNIPGEADFKGHLSHSHNYRNAKGFSGKRVVVVGASSSGLDIAREIALEAEAVFLSARQPLPQAPQGKHGKILARAPPKRITSTGVEFEDGTVEEGVDAIVYCTGYYYRFPFLSPDNGIVHLESGDGVKPLYHHLLPPDAPSLAFVGLPAKIVPFPLMEMQARYLAMVWAGQIALPPEEEMARDAAVWEKQQEALPDKYFHLMGGGQFGYNDDLARLCSVAPLPAWRKRMYADCSRNKRAFPDTYRDVPLPSVQDYMAAIDAES
ncbi:hypothetical protein T484DRAFT_1958430, partial [Baffinella frigidus]